MAGLRDAATVGMLINLERLFTTRGYPCQLAPLPPVARAARAVWCHYHSCTLFGAACRGCGVRVHGLHWKPVTSHPNTPDLCLFLSSLIC